MENIEEEWDAFPHMKKKNFKCFLSNKGIWKDKNGYPQEEGKTIFNIVPKGERLAPTFVDQRNFFTGLFEAEWRNDNFVFENGTSRPPQREKKIKMFMDILETISERADIKNTPNGIDFYIKKFKVENGSEN